jgi:uncharacterized protein
MIGFVRCECILYNLHSLKDKRSVLKRLMNRISQSGNIALIEADYHDLWQRTALEIVTIGIDKTKAEKELQRAINVIDSFTEVERTVTNFEWL